MGEPGAPGGGQRRGVCRLVRQICVRLERNTGALLWKYETGNDVNSSPAVVNGMVYIGSDDGNLYAFGLPSEQMSEKFSPPQRPDPARLTPNWSLQPVRH